MEVEFSSTPIKNYVNNLRIYNSSPTLYQIFSEPNKYNLTTLFIRDLRYRMSKDLNVNVMIKGLQGTGKSMLARMIKSILDEENQVHPTIADIGFTRSETLERFKDVPKKTTIINDEDYDYVTQVGATRIREQLELIEQVIRMDQINFISCSVSRVPHLFTYKLEAMDVDYEKGLTRAILYDKLNADDFITKPLGFIVLSKDLLNPELEEQYLLKKAEFLKKVKLGAVRNIAQEMDKRAAQVMQEFNFKKGTPRPVIKIACRKLYPYLSETELIELIDVIYYRDKMKSFTSNENDNNTEETNRISEDN